MPQSDLFCSKRNTLNLKECGGFEFKIINLKIRFEFKVSEIQVMNLNSNHYYEFKVLNSK